MVKKSHWRCLQKQTEKKTGKCTTRKNEKIKLTRHKDRQRRAQNPRIWHLCRDCPSLHFATNTQNNCTRM